MKRLFFALAMAGLLSTTATAAPFTDEDLEFILYDVASTFLKRECGSKLVDKGLQRYGDVLQSA